ncbi:MAG: glycosyltransferase [Chitinivibrionales bacterium]|nr:glycosyltransferase [Chitinivibrionales bacterium]
MISVIVCSRNEKQSALHQQSVANTIGHAYEYVRVDNSNTAFSLCSAYNTGVDRAQGDIVVFAHEDVFFLEPDWGGVLVRKFCDNPQIGLVGVAGSQYLLKQFPGWPAAGQPFLKGKVLHEIDGRYLLSVFSHEKGDAEVVAVDGLFFAVRSELFNSIRFDSENFNGFHFYDLDICMQVRKSHSLIVTDDILVKHQSRGSFDKTWKLFGDRFVQKYANELPAACVEGTPQPENFNKFDSFDITARIAQSPFAQA